jgi:hypothetical protein
MCDRGGARSVGSVGPRRLDRDAARTTWRKVNVGESALTHAGIGRAGARQESIERTGEREAQLPGPGDGPMGPSP